MKAENAVPILRELIENGRLSQRQLADRCGLSLGTVNHVVNRAIEKKYLERREEGLYVTEAGFDWLVPYQVKNAIILAAGFSASALSLSATMPPGFLEVKGEIMIERQIEQLLERGIREIAIVVGFRMESYDYLVDRYGVKLIYNPDFSKINNFASLMYALDYLDNTYLLVADSYLEENLFHRYEPYAWYSVSYCEGETSDWCVDVTPGGKIKNMRLGGKNCMTVVGPAYYDCFMSENIRSFFEHNISEAEMTNAYWEARLLEHFEDFPKRANIQTGKVYEFTRIEDVHAYDKAYLKEVRDQIAAYYADAWSISSEKIEKITPLADEVGYDVYKFVIDRHEYVLRVPDKNCEAFIDNAKVKQTYELLAPLEVTDEVLNFDIPTGIRVTRYVERSSFVDPFDDRDLADSMQLIRLIHDRKLKVDYDYDIEKMTAYYENKVYRTGGMPFRDIDDVKAKMRNLLKIKERLNIEPVLCHGDYLYAHVVRKTTGGLFIINWEFAGMSDPLMDVAMFGIYSYFDQARLDLSLALYLGRAPTQEELIRLYLYVALGGLLWSMWGLQRKRSGFDLGAYPLKMYRYLKDFYPLAMV